MSDRPTEHAEQQWCSRHQIHVHAGFEHHHTDCPASAHSYGPQHAPSGEHQHSWARSEGWGRACSYCSERYETWLEAQVTCLQAELAQRTAELERLRSQVDNCQANAHYRAWQESQAELADYKAGADEEAKAGDDARRHLASSRAAFAAQFNAADALRAALARLSKYAAGRDA